MKLKLRAALAAWGTLLSVAYAADLYVAGNGNDAWSGRLAGPKANRSDGPFASLERARDEIRKWKRTGGLPKGGVRVFVRGGFYALDKVFELTAEDSGTETAPVLYSATQGEEVRLVGGRLITGFKAVTDQAILTRLEESARGKVFQADLRSLGLTNYGSAGGGGLELFFHEKPMRLARWPNQGFARIADVLGKTPVDVRGTKGTVEGIFRYEGNRPERWTAEKDAWLHGYWFWDWSDQRQRVKAIDAGQHTIELQPPYHGYGYRKGQWFYGFNILAELDLTLGLAGCTAVRKLSSEMLSGPGPQR